MDRYCVALLLLSLSTSDAYKFLVYSPLFGYSHTHFMGAIADTLTERPDTSNLISDDALMKRLADEKFDVGIAEAFSICGLGIFEILKIPSSISTFSGVHSDITSNSIGEPITPSYVPGESHGNQRRPYEPHRSHEKRV
ncbi:hypothetical protein OSTOST_14740, partial [Ostertagia ostertagi]